MGHGSHQRLVIAVIDHLCLSVLRGEVFKGHDSGLPRLQDVNVYTKTQNHSLSSGTDNACTVLLCTVCEIAVMVQYYELPSGFVALSQFLPVFPLSTKLTFTPCTGFAISSGKLDCLQNIGAHNGELHFCVPQSIFLRVTHPDFALVHPLSYVVAYCTLHTSGLGIW